MYKVSCNWLVKPCAILLLQENTSIYTTYKHVYVLYMYVWQPTHMYIVELNRRYDVTIIIRTGTYVHVGVREAVRVWTCTFGQKVDDALIDVSHPFRLLCGRGSKHSKRLLRRYHLPAILPSWGRRGERK